MMAALSETSWKTSVWLTVYCIADGLRTELSEATLM